jgi:hypothetical protein
MSFPEEERIHIYIHIRIQFRASIKRVTCHLSLLGE